MESINYCIYPDSFGVLIANSLRSWKSTYVALSQLGRECDTTTIRRYLTDPQTIHLLAHPFSPFSAPTSQSNSSFETKTSAINVTPSPHAHYDIKEIKDDTLWLSKETHIDEVAALRIALLEWQTRSAVQLLRGNPGGLAISLNGRGGANGLQASYFDAGSSLLAKSSFIDENRPTFEEDGVRHQRLLETYLSERRYLLKTSEYISFARLCTLGDGPEKATGPRQNTFNWMGEVGDSSLSSWGYWDDSKSSSKSLIIEVVEALRSRFNALTRASGWLVDTVLQEDIDIAWGRNQLVEAIHIMQILLNVLAFSSNVVKAPAILAWFRLMNECGFFESLQLVCLETQYQSSTD